MDRGQLLFEYRPPRAHPIVYAGLLVLGFVMVTGSIENALRQSRPEVYAVYALAFVATLWFYVLLYPSSIRIHVHGIAPSRPLVARWWRPFVRWDALAAVYPVSYDVTGAFVSPFASSDGKVTQTGLGLEDRSGRIEVVRFTPTRFSLNASRSRGFKEALEVVRGIQAGRGVKMVPHARVFSQDEQAAMRAEARKPFLPFFAIVVLFASAAPMVWLLAEPLGLPIEVAVPASLLLPLATSLQSWRRSRARNRILNQISKATEFAREAA